MLRQEFPAHQVMLHAPAQINRHVIVGVDGVNGKLFFLNALNMIGNIIHSYAVIVSLWLYFCGLIGDFQSHLLLRQRDTGAAGDGVLIIRRKTDGFAVLQRHITRQHIGGKAGQKVPQILRLGVSVQHFHFLLAEHIHAVGVAVQATLAPVQAEPDPVEDGQFFLFHHIGKALIETRLKYHAAGVDTGGVFLLAAHCHRLGEQLTAFQQFFLLAQYSHHDMGLVRFGHLYGLWPHIVVFGVDLRFIVRDVTVEECHDQHHIADPHYHSVIAVLNIFVALIRLLIYDTPFFPQISDQLLLVPLCFGEEHRSGKGTLMVGFLLVGVILKTLCIFIRIIEGFMLQSADKFLKAVCQMGNFIVIFLIHMDYRRLSLRAASPVVQENHIVSGAWTVTDGHTDGRILPLIDHKLTAQLSTEGAALFPSDSENAGDGHMII